MVNSGSGQINYNASLFKLRVASGQLCFVQIFEAEKLLSNFLMASTCVYAIILFIRYIQEPDRTFPNLISEPYIPSNDVSEQH